MPKAVVHLFSSMETEVRCTRCNSIIVGGVVGLLMSDGWRCIDCLLVTLRDREAYLKEHPDEDQSREWTRKVAKYNRE